MIGDMGEKGRQGFAGDSGKLNFCSNKERILLLWSTIVRTR